MTAAIVVTIIAALALAIGCVGIVYPILPGSLLVLGGVVLWGLTVRETEGWVALALGVPLTLAGMSAQMAITGTSLKRRKIPNRALLVGLVGGVIGMFLIPVVGLFLGFVVGLLLHEMNRQDTFSDALSSSWVAAKAMGVGILVELGCALLTCAVFVLCALAYFVTA